MTEYSKSTIESLIITLDNKLTEKAEVVTIGGTALALLEKRFYSKDIDICYKCNSPSDFAQAVIDSAKESGITPEDIHMFGGFEMTYLEIPRFSERAHPYEEFSLKNIELKTMHPIDIILSKIYRGYPRDIKDINCLLNDNTVTLPELRKRFLEVARAQKDFTVREEFVRKYESFIKAYQKTK